MIFAQPSDNSGIYPGGPKPVFVRRFSIKNEKLAAWIRFIWFLRAENADIHYKLLPTDSFDVLLNLAEPIRYQVGTCLIQAPPAHINGLRAGYSLVHQTGKTVVWGVSFEPFGLSLFVENFAKKKQNGIMDLNRFCPVLAQSLTQAVSGKGVEEAVFCIENALCRKIRHDNQQIKGASFTAEFLRFSGTIQDFCKVKQISVKTLERIVLRHTGDTPKILQRIRRFQIVSNQLVNQKAALTDIAFNNAFSDQAHFSKEFRMFSGASPKVFQVQKASVKQNVIYDFQ